MTGPYAYVSYEASKAALSRNARSVACENAANGVRANTILPAPIQAPHVSDFAAPDVDPETLARVRAATVPLGRRGSACDIANAALFLASDEAAFITGVVQIVDGTKKCGALILEY